MAENKEKTTLADRLLSLLGILMCIVLIPILIINCTLLFKGYTQKENVPSIGGIFPMIVLTDSMHPVFSGGDLIICENLTPEEVAVGDVITFFDPDGNGTSIVTHRVTQITEAEGQLAFRTRGDNNNSEDRKAVPGEKLVGVYTGLRIPGAGNVAMFMQTTTGLIVCVLLPVLLLVGYDVLRRQAYDKKHAKDKDQLLAELEELRRMKAELAGRKDP